MRTFPQLHNSYFLFGLTVCLAVIGPVSATHSQDVVFREDFGDPDLPTTMLTERSQASIDAGVGAGIRETRDGSHFVRGENGEHVFTRIPDMSLPHSIEMRARITESTSVFGFILVGVMNEYGDEYYWAGTYLNGGVAAGWATDTNVATVNGPSRLVDPLDWFTLRLDVGADEMSLWAWQEPSSQPDVPSMTYPTDRFDETQLTTVFFDWNSPDSGNQPWLEVDYIQVTTIPEPSSLALASISILVSIAATRRRLNAFAIG